MIKYIVTLLTLLTVLSYGQIPTGDRNAWVDTLMLSKNSAYVDLTSYFAVDNIGDIANISADSVGATVYLKQVNSVGGGGALVYRDSTTVRDHLGAQSNVAGISYASNKAGKRWYRRKALEGGDIDVKWFGPASDGSTNDLAAMEAARDAAIGLDRALYLSEGNYAVGSGGFSDGLTTLLTTDFIIYGDGVNRTVITAVDTALNFNHSSGYTRALNVMDMRILGPGSETSGSVGIYVNRLSSSNFSRLHIGGFEYDLTGTQLEASYFERIVWDDAVTAVNLRDGVTLNGNTFASCSNSTQIDSFVYDWGAGSGNQVDGGEGGNCVAFLRQDGTNFSQFTINAVNLESCDSTFAIVNNNCQLTVTNSRFANIGGTSTKYFIEGYGTSEIKMINLETAEDFPKFLQSGTSTRFFDINIKNKTKYAYSPTNNTFYTITNYSDYIYDNSGVTEDTSAAGRFTRMIPRKAVAATTIERLLYTFRYENEIATVNLINGTDQLGTNNATLTTQPVELHNYRTVDRWSTVTFGTGDSTEVTVTADTNGWNASTLLFAAATLHMSGNATMYNVTASIKSEDRNAGTVTFVLWHNGITMNAVSRRMLFHFKFYPQEWNR